MRRHELQALFEKAIDERRDGGHEATQTLIDYCCACDIRTLQDVLADVNTARDALENALRLADGTDHPQDYWDKDRPPYDGWEAEKDRQIASFVGDFEFFTKPWWIP